MDEFLQLIEKRRSIRKFTGQPVPSEVLRRLVRLASLAPSGANLQPLKFITVAGKKSCEQLFPCTRWAGYLSDGAPKEGERPSAYIVLLGDTEIKRNCDIDAGIALGTITIAAMAMGFATCLIGALDRDKLRELLQLPNRYEIHTVIAVGKAGMEAEICEVKHDDIKYFYRDKKFFVPKRTLEEVLLREIIR